MTVGLGRGLYSPAQMAIHRTLIRAVQAQRAASQVIATAFSESSVNGRGSIISSIDLNIITTTVGFLFFPLYFLVGRWYATAIGILIGLYITKLLFCAAWRVIITGRQRGCGPWLILAILESGFTIVRSPYFLMEETMQQLLRGLDEIASSEDSVPSSEAQFRRMLNRLKNKHTASQIAARHQQVFQHRQLRRMNNIMVAEAAAAEPAVPKQSHVKFCSEFPDLSNEYFSLVHIDNQRADIELQRRKEDLQDDIRMLTEAAQHLRAEKGPHHNQNHPADRLRDQEAPLLPPKQSQARQTVNMNECINLSLNSMLTPSTTTLEPTSSSASPPMSVASGQHVRFNEDIDVAAQREPLIQVGTVAAYGQDTACQTCALPITPSQATPTTTQAQATPTTMRQRRSPPCFKSGFKRKK
jgi:hypothetical protein